MVASVHIHTLAALQRGLLGLAGRHQRSGEQAFNKRSITVFGVTSWVQVHQASECSQMLPASSNVVARKV